MQSDFEKFNAQAEEVFEAQRKADRRAVEKDREFESAVAEASKYYIPRSQNPPHIFQRPS